jgi:6,7-dimethyl-8-ribityllumazine synthase
LRAGAEDALRSAAAFRVDVIDVPGAFELPLAARVAAQTHQFDAIVCLGCLVRGETPHFDYISSAVAHGITEASLATGVPMSFGVLTTDTLEQARARALPDSSNKGWEAAVAAVEMVHVLRRITDRAVPPLRA